MKIPGTIGARDFLFQVVDTIRFHVYAAFTSFETLYNKNRKNTLMQPYWKTALLTIYFFIGILIPSCDFLGPGIDCDCPIDEDYFDVQGLQMDYLDDTGILGDIVANQEIAFNQLPEFYVDYEVEYHAQIEPQQWNWGLNTMPAALACSCLPPGYEGSKTEILENFDIITLNDFDEDHPAGSSILDLFEYKGYYEDEIDGELLADFVNGTMGNLLMYEDMRLDLIQAPILDATFQFRVILELSEGERYEVESLPLVIL